MCEIFNSVHLCSGVGIVWSTTTRTRVSDATAVTFSVKCFNPLKHQCQKTSSESGLLHIFIHSRAFNNNMISNGNLIAVTTVLLTSGLHLC